jgi:alcohol dehydrogenase
VTLLDPSLTLSLATNETLYPALDALSHALESLWNRNRTKTSQEYALCSITLICANLRLVLDNPCSLEARKNLQKAATFSGLAISITKTAIAHAISYPLTLQYGMPHGLACSFTLQAILIGQKTGVLGITEQLKQDIIELMRSLHLERSLIHYLSFSELMALFDKKLDASRAGNFIDAVDKDWLLNILHNSWSQNLESGIET